MNIRRFVASDMRKVLREVRAALGADAVILSTQNTDDGVEIIAAVDYDDSLLNQWAGKEANETRPQEPGEQVAEREADEDRTGFRNPPDLSPVAQYADIAADISSADTPSGSVRRRPGVEQGPPSAAAAPTRMAEPELEDAAGSGSLLGSPRVAAELSDLRELLERQLFSLGWNDTNRRRPVYAQTLRQLSRLGLDPAVATRLAHRVAQDATLEGGPWRIPMQLLGESLPLARQDLVDVSGVFAVVGPTGVGKTTTIAKIAARFVLRHGIDKLGLVTTDAYRIGARDQLMTFARILGTPMHVARNAAEMSGVLDGLRDKQLVLVDTAGMSQRDARLARQFETLADSGREVRTLLALSAATDLGGLRDTLRAFRQASPAALIATKLDEVVSLGPLLSLVLDANLPLVYLCDGQRVPEDLHQAGHRRSWLLRKAVELAAEQPRGGGEADLAAAFGGPTELAVNG